MDVADGYVTFVRHSQDMLREKVNEEVYIERLFDVSKHIVTFSTFLFVFPLIKMRLNNNMVSFTPPSII